MISLLPLVFQAIAMFAFIGRIYRMVFKKREPVDDKEAYSQANRLDGGYVDQEMPVEEPFPFEDLPMDLVGKVFSLLTYADAIHLAQTSRQVRMAYDAFRGQIKGPKVTVYANIEDGKMVARARPSHLLSGEADIIPEDKRRMFFRNADVSLHIRLGRNELTDAVASAILETFGRSNMLFVKLRALTVSCETKDLVNSLECLDVVVSIFRYNENVSLISNVTSLSVKSSLFFFQLEAIIRHDLHLQYLTATVTAASLPRIFECIDEWKAGRRSLTCWYFKVPHVEIVRDFGGVPLDWRRSIIRSEDGRKRLMMQTKTLRREEGDAFLYQTVNWLQM